MTVEVLKLNLIQQIMNLQDVARLQKVSVILQETSLENDLVHRLAKPMRKRLDIEQIKKEQGFQPIDKQAFFQKIDSLQIEESIEELLEML